MSTTIQANNRTGTYSVPWNIQEREQTRNQTSRFLHMTAQASRSQTDTPITGTNGVTGGTGTINPAMDFAVKSVKQIQTESAEAAEAPSLETMLKAKYPNLVYHVFDASSSYWKTRNDYPHYLLYQSGDKAAQTLENWQPEGENPFYGSVDGRFIAPKEIHALGNVPPGSKAVVIHPKVQERMEQDPEYAEEILAKIDTWFAFDVARNEAMRTGSTIGMSQAVAIGEDGNICNAVSSSSGGEITYSSDEMVRAYRLRMAKRADFMRWLVKKQREDSIQDSIQVSSSMAKAQLAQMINNGKLLEIFGDKIAGIPTETVLAITQAQIWDS